LFGIWIWLYLFYFFPSRLIDCKHFDSGNGNCPFGASCFYKVPYFLCLLPSFVFSLVKFDYHEIWVTSHRILGNNFLYLLDYFLKCIHIATDKLSVLSKSLYLLLTYVHWPQIWIIKSITMFFSFLFLYLENCFFAPLWGL
jgi:hypothetical protein